MMTLISKLELVKTACFSPETNPLCPAEIIYRDRKHAVLRVEIFICKRGSNLSTPAMNLLQIRRLSNCEAFLFCLNFLISWRGLSPLWWPPSIFGTLLLL
jgi:hypothetical protein